MMSIISRHLEDGESGAGSVSVVLRDGARVRRPRGAWTPAVHALLRHLSDKEYGYAPKVLALEPECEVLEYLEGQVAMRPWPSCLVAEAGIVALGAALKAYHEVVADFVPPFDAIWRDPEARWEPGMIIRHGDLGPWNTVWQQDRLVGIIDWDMAEPGYAIDDIAQLAWYAVPLRPAPLCRECGIEPGTAQARRLELLCGVCGVSRAEVLKALQRLQMAELERTIRLGLRGVEPWATFHARGDVAAITADLEWLREWMKGVR